MSYSLRRPQEVSSTTNRRTISRFKNKVYLCRTFEFFKHSSKEFLSSLIWCQEILEIIHRNICHQLLRTLGTFGIAQLLCLVASANPILLLRDLIFVGWPCCPYFDLLQKQNDKGNWPMPVASCFHT